MSRRWLWHSLWLAPLLLIAVVLIGFTWVLFSEAGTRTAVSTLERFVGLRVQSTQGRLGEHLQLANIELDSPELSLANLELVWQPRALLSGELAIDKLEANGLRLVLPSSDQPAEPSRPALPEVPIAIRIVSAQLSDLKIINQAQVTVIERLGFGLDWRGQQLSLDRLELNHAQGALQGRVGLLQAEQLNLDLELALASELTGRAINADAALVGPLDALAFKVQTSGAYRLSLQGVVDALSPSAELDIAADLIELGSPQAPAGQLEQLKLTTQASMSALEFTLRALVSTPAIAKRQLIVSGNLDTQSSFEQQASAVLNWRSPVLGHSPDDAPETQLSGQATANFDGDRVTLDHRTPAPYQSTLHAIVDKLSSDAEVTASLNAAQWNLAAMAGRDVELVALTLSAGGPLERLRLSAGIELSDQQVGSIVANADGHLAADSFDLSHLRVRALDGELAVDGDLEFRDELALKANFSASDLNFAAFHPDLTSAIGSRGQLSIEAGNQVQANFEQFSGHWRGHKLSGHARVAASPTAISLESVDLALGNSHLNAVLSVAEELSGSFDFELTDVAMLSEQLSGAMSANGRIGGSRDAPIIDAMLRANALAFDDWKLATLKADVDVNLSDEVASSLNLVASELRGGGEDYGELSLVANGQPVNHELLLQLVGPRGELELALNGRLQQPQWDGSVNALTLNEPRLGEWLLDAPAAIHYQPEHLDLGQLCITQTDAKLCVTAEHVSLQASAAGGRAQVSIERLPLGIANDFLPQTVVLEGWLEGAISATNSLQGWLGEARLETQAAAIRYDTGDGQAESIPVEKFAVRARADESIIEFNADGVLRDWIEIASELTLTRDDRGALSGTVDIKADDIAWLAAFEPRIAGSSGGLGLSMNLAGTRDAPVAELNITSEDGQLFLPDLGIVLEQLAFEGRLPNGRDLSVNGRLVSGAGSVELNGQITLGEAQQLAGKLTLVGQDFAAIRLSEGEADISPDLALAFSAEHLDVSGTLLIPKLKLTQPPASANVVSVSADQVIVEPGSDGNEEQPPDDFVTDKVSADVTIKLGDDATVDMLGLRAALAGNLHVIKKPGDSLGRGEGRLQIKGGEFEAYGQHLSINKGDLIFAGPLDNPSLDLRAVRPGLDVTVGISASGAVRQPTLGLFSTPAMSDADILSYLVTGHALDDASSGEAGIIAQAALGLGAEKSTAITSRVQSAFGLDEFSVKAGDTAQSSSLVAGKRLSPKVTVRADFNPFDRLWTLFLNYRLTKRFSVEAESGESQGADLIYSHESDTLWPGSSKDDD